MQGENIKKIKHTKNIALIIGNEGNGVKDNLKKYASSIFLSYNLHSFKKNFNIFLTDKMYTYLK